MEHILDLLKLQVIEFRSKQYFKFVKISKKKYFLNTGDKVSLKVNYVNNSMYLM